MAKTEKDITDRQAAQHFTKLGKQLLERAQTSHDISAARSILNAGAKAKFGVIDEKIEGLVDFLCTHATENRERLTDDGKVKHFDFETGQYTWRLSSHVELGDEDAVVVLIEALIVKEEAKGDKSDPDKIAQLKSFLRPAKVTIDKEAMLKEANRVLAASITGITIVEQEIFTAAPKDSPTDDKDIRPLIQRVVET